MIKRVIHLASMLLVCATAMAQNCVLSGFTRLAANTSIEVGPNVFNSITNVPEIGTAILAARDAWDTTNAINRIGDWNGLTSGSDCPAGQPFQIGALAFAGSTCATLTAYGLTGQNASALAFVDYYPWQCPQCGTKSVTINVNFAWSVAPYPGQYDLQSVLTHEFGHVLGLGHMEGGGTFCNSFPPNTRSPSCAESNDRETMGRNTYSAYTNFGSFISNEEICQRDLTQWDRNSANSSYP